MRRVWMPPLRDLSRRNKLRTRRRTMARLAPALFTRARIWSSFNATSSHQSSLSELAAASRCVHWPRLRCQQNRLPDRAARIPSPPASPPDHAWTVPLHADPAAPPKASANDSRLLGISRYSPNKQSAERSRPAAAGAGRGAKNHLARHAPFMVHMTNGEV